MTTFEGPHGKTGSGRGAGRRRHDSASVLELSDGKKLLAPLALALIAAKEVGSSSYFAPRFGYDVLSTYVPSPNRRWNAIAVSPKGAVLSDATELTRRHWTGALVLVVISLILVAFSARHIGRADRRLRDARQRLADQNLALVAANDDFDSSPTSPPTTSGRLSRPSVASHLGRESLDCVVTQVARMSRLIDALLDVARAGTTRMEAQSVTLPRWSLR